VDGDTWKAVDPERAAEFMRLARQAREVDGDGAPPRTDRLKASLRELVPN